MTNNLKYDSIISRMRQKTFNSIITKNTTMNEALEIVEVNRRAFIEKWKPGKASELIFAIRAKYDILYNNKSQNGNKDGIKESSIIDGMEGR